jgi:hypothetical protein
MRSITEAAFNPFRVSLLALGSALAIIAAVTCLNPAYATPYTGPYTFTFDDMYLLKAAAPYSSVFSGATGTASSNGIYQETTTGGTPIV